MRRTTQRVLDGLWSDSPSERSEAILSCAATRTEPLVILVDDLDELEDAEGATIEQLVKGATTEPLVVVATARQPVPGWPTTAAPLRPLSDETIGRLLAERGLEEQVAERIRSMVAGNPLAAISLAGSLTPDERAGIERVPDPVVIDPLLAAACAASVEHLTTAARRATLERAALARFAAHGEGRSVPEGSAGLPWDSQPWPGAAALAMATPDERRRAHTSAAERSSSATAALLHRAAAAEHPDDELARTLSAAAADCAGTDLPVAIELLVASGGVAEEPSLTGDAWYRAAVAGYLTGQHRRVLDLVGALRHLDGSGVAPARLDRLEGLAGFHLRGVDSTILDLEAAAERCTSRAEDGAALTLLLGAGVFALYGCRIDHLSVLAERGASLGDAAPLSQATVAVFSASADLYARTDARALRALGPALAALVDAPPSDPIPDLDLDVSRSMFYGGLLFMTDEHWDRARSLLGRVVERDRAAGWTGLEGLNVAWYAELLWRTGAWEEALGVAAETLGSRGASLGRSRLWAEAFCAKAALLTGDGDAADRHRAAVEADAGSQQRIPLVQLLLHSGIGLGLLGEGDAEGALDHLRMARDLAGPVGHPGLVWCRAELIEALAVTGRRAEAAAEAEALDRSLAEGAPPVLSGRALRARGLATGGRRGLGLLRRAVDAHERGGSPFELGRSLLCLAEASDLLGKDPDQVAPVAERSVELFDRLGAAAFAARARRVGASTPVADRLAGLTSREAEIAKLVAGGATNKDAASALAMSPKTVSFHLGSVFKKLRVTSRTQLAALLRDP